MRRQVIDEQREESAKAQADSNDSLQARFDGELSKAKLEWAAERERMEQEQIDQWRVAEAQRQLDRG